MLATSLMFCLLVLLLFLLCWLLSLFVLLWLLLLCVLSGSAVFADAGHGNFAPAIRGMLCCFVLQPFILPCCCCCIVGVVSVVGCCS